MTTIGEVLAFLDRRYPARSAESWDRVGLVTGDVAGPANHLLLSVDVTDAVIDQAATLGTDLIIAHHPLLLRGINSVDPRRPKGRMITRLIRSGIGLITAHTNADIPVGGVADSLAAALGLTDTRPLRRVPVYPADKLVTYVPVEQTDAVIDALSDAGAGEVGAYRRAAFTVTGTGTFTPGPEARPAIGQPGRREQVAETMIEMIMDRRLRGRVIDALLRTHPYEVPAYFVTETAGPADIGPTAGLGRIGRVAATRLADFAERVAAALPGTAAGIRVAGDPDRMINTVALQGGAGDDLLDTAREAGADVYLTSDLRHHPASEAIAWPDAPALIDVPHWAAEWTWLPRLRRQLVDELDGIAVNVSEINTDPWNFRI
jgi:dinuclear metal center YbgI/SA1388 family protein